MLTDTKIKQAKVTDKPYKIYDSEAVSIHILGRQALTT